ncbi:C1 family peptidase [Planosporangium thailandense]|uniref:C1 family peptidase n=1 Tax=Planosporangium thailandense TaxID=765197 RepID=A0ABX0Y7F8_9ACTN|nr:C1 family peptidase [Planosporangium thailandense]NJC74006.1 C1 family peptidase [Planosporangium thailandense]
MTTPTPRSVQRYGWIPDLPDQRDHLFAAPPTVLATLPPAVDLRDQCPKEIYDQGQLGSCTANAIAAAFEFGLLKQKLTDFMPSRLFIYYNERVMEGTVDSDSGAMIRDGIKSVSKQGVCAETTWPYDIARFTDQPPHSCYQEALGNRVTSYQRIIQSLSQLKGCLAHGYPFVFGFRVYESFESEEVARTGDVPMPQATEQALGGHAVLAVGYDDATARFLVRNSWGTGWGQAGYFTMPYAYLTERGLSSDFWAVLQVS